MARRIQIKRGTAANTLILDDGELGLQMDVGKLLVGNGEENLPVTMGTELDTVKIELNAAIVGKAAANHIHDTTQVGARPSMWVPSKWDIELGDVDNTSDSQKSVNYAATAGNTNAVGGREAGTVLSEINGLNISVVSGKSQVASAITDKGVGTSANADYGTMANNIREIKTWTKWSQTEWFEVTGYGTVDISKYLFVFGYTDRVMIIDVQNRRTFAWSGYDDSIVTNPVQVDNLDIGSSCTYHANAKTIASSAKYDNDFIGVY